MLPITLAGKLAEEMSLKRPRSYRKNASFDGHLRILETHRDCPHASTRISPLFKKRQRIEISRRSATVPLVEVWQLQLQAIIEDLWIFWEGSLDEVIVSPWQVGQPLQSRWVDDLRGEKSTRFIYVPPNVDIMFLSCAPCVPLFVAYEISAKSLVWTSEF